MLYYILFLNKTFQFNLRIKKYNNIVVQEK